jgi:hypothetical protein
MANRNRYSRKQAEDLAYSIAQDLVGHYSTEMIKAIIKTFKEDYGFGEKRMRKLLNNIKKNLPENMNLSFEGEEVETDERASA